MSKRQILSAAFLAGMATDAALAAETVSEADELISAPAEPSDLVGTSSDEASLTIAELMYAGDANVGVGPSPGPITIRAPIPAKPKPDLKTGDKRGTSKVRKQNENSPPRLPGDSKKGA